MDRSTSHRPAAVRRGQLEAAESDHQDALPARADSSRGVGAPSLQALMSAGGNQAMVQLSRGDGEVVDDGASGPKTGAEMEADSKKKAAPAKQGGKEAKKRGSLQVAGGMGSARSMGDLERSREDGEEDGNEGGDAPAEEQAAPANLAINSTINLATSIVNDRAANPFGSELPEYILTGAFEVAGDTVNVTVQFQAIEHWGVNGGGRTDVPSGAADVVTADSYQDIYDDLVPSDASPHKSRRTDYWSESLTARHERFHAQDDIDWLNAEGTALAKAYLDGQTVTSEGIQAQLDTLIAQCKARLDRGSLEYYYGGAADPGHSNRAGEILAYGDGQEHYQALAEAAKAHGESLAAAARGGEGGDQQPEGDPAGGQQGQ